MLTSRLAGEATEGVVTRSGDIPEPFSKPSPKQIFEGLCFYLNGSTAPLVSDLKLKQLLASRGGQTSIVLGRRHVTHVIVGAAQGQGGIGGVLSASKMQKEIARTGGKGVKFVGAEWYVADHPPSPSPHHPTRDPTCPSAHIPRTCARTPVSSHQGLVAQSPLQLEKGGMAGGWIEFVRASSSMTESWCRCSSSAAAAAAATHKVYISARTARRNDD